MARRGSSQLEEVLEPDGDAVARRLRELGVPPELVGHAVRVGHLRSDFTTEAHPRTYPGTVVWGETTGALRGGLSLLGWKMDDTDNISRAISPNGEVTVVAVRGNEFTGMRSRYERLNTRRPRGEAGVRIVKQNTQYELALREGGVQERHDLVPNLGGTWFLLYNRVGDVVRCELSFARAVSDSGKLLRWSERLILPDVDLLLPPSDSGEDDTTPPEVDVPVTRRAS